MWTFPMGEFQPVDLARFRQLYAVYGLLCLPSFAWVADYPDSLFAPPVGPLGLFDGFPSAWVLYGLEIAVAVCFAALLIGVRVAVASVAATVLMVVGYGLTYSLGKIDHNILFVLTPGMLAIAGWSGRRPVSQLAMRLWAFMVALAMLSAGLSKAEAGWLDPSTQAVRGSLAGFRHVADRSGPLADHALGLPDWSWLWEPMDIAAVTLECGLVLVVFSWIWFRRALALLCVFHLSVALMFGIVFAVNVLAYGAFVRWGRVTRWPSVAAPAWVVPALGVGIWGVARVVHPEPIVVWLVVGVGAALGVRCLLPGVVWRIDAEGTALTRR
jgi:hypothetical protein